MLFISLQKLFSFSRYLSFFSWFLGHVAKRLDKKDNVNFKFYGDTAWSANNCNTCIDQYLEKKRQPDNETWWINRILQEKYYAENDAEETSSRLLFIL